LIYLDFKAVEFRPPQIEQANVETETVAKEIDRFLSVLGPGCGANKKPAPLRCGFWEKVGAGD
jgi:hypothetical protein